jgi:hypothetical protein
MKVGKTIEKKILPEYFKAVHHREKTFELRKDDSDYQVGDMLRLREWDGEKYTGNITFKQITYILRDCPAYGLMPGYCILAIQPRMWEEQYKSQPRIVLDGRNEK